VGSLLTKKMLQEIYLLISRALRKRGTHVVRIPGNGRVPKIWAAGMRARCPETSAMPAGVGTEKI
jgi:hypothetical protein